MLKDADLMQRPLGDGQLFDVLGRWYHRDPPQALLWAAANLYEGASPAMIQEAARWLGVAQDLREAGLDAATIARVMLSTSAGEPPGWRPPGPVLAQALEAAGEARESAEPRGRLLNHLGVNLVRFKSGGYARHRLAERLHRDIRVGTREELEEASNSAPLRGERPDESRRHGPLVAHDGSFKVGPVGHRSPFDLAGTRRSTW